jgi:hypothetical protein
VSAVDPNRWFERAGHSFHAPGEPGGADSVANGRLGNRKSALNEDPSYSSCNLGVALSEPTLRWRRVRPCTVNGNCSNEVHRSRFGLFGDDREGLGGKFADDSSGSRLDDAGLVPGDIGDVRSERDEVIQADAGDNADKGVNDIGGVKPSARPYLHDGDVDPAQGKPPKPKYAPRFAIADWPFFPLGLNEASRSSEDA